MNKKKSAMVLGYTRSGHEVLLPESHMPDMDPFDDWIPGDHIDASRILVEHGEREVDPIGSWCKHWAEEHWEIGKRAKKKLKKARARTQIRGAAEATILAGRRRR